MAEQPASVLSGGEGGGQGEQWFAGYDDELKGVVSSKGWDKMPLDKAAPEILKWGRGAESKLGVPADQIIRLPGEKATADEIKAFRTKLGVPENIEGYELKAPEGHDDTFLKTATGWFHKHGVPKATAAALAQEWNEYVQAAQVAEAGKFDQQAESDLNALKGEWKGDDFAKNVDLAKRVRRTMGLTDDEAQAVEKAIGLKRAAQVFAKLGSVLGEHRFAGGNEQKGGFGMSPQEAKARITALQADSAWAAKYLAGDADAKAEFTRLQQIANPEQLAA